MNEGEISHFAVQSIWESTGDANFPYKTMVGKQTWILRINDFPDEQLYTLIIDDNEIANFDDWPLNWQRDRRKTSY